MTNLTSREKHLIKRMEAAEDFGYDDEEVELKKLLTARGLNWKWNDSMFSPKVIVYKN